MKRITLMNLCFITLLIATGCSSLSTVMREPTATVKLNKSDFTLSNRVMAEATTVKILGIDWARLFSKNEGSLQQDGSASVSLANIPVIGNMVADKTKNYALYNLMQQNTGYDVVFYPSYETKKDKPFLGLGFIVQITKVKATARLGKLND